MGYANEENMNYDEDEEYDETEYEKYEREQEEIKAAQNAKDMELITALITCPTIKTAAEVSNVSESTVYRRLRDYKFKESLDEARREQCTMRMNALANLASKSFQVLNDILEDENAENKDKLKAVELVAKIIIKDSK